MGNQKITPGIRKQPKESENSLRKRKIPKESENNLGNQKIKKKKPRNIVFSVAFLLYCF